MNRSKLEDVFVSDRERIFRLNGPYPNFCFSLASLRENEHALRFFLLSVDAMIRREARFKACRHVRRRASLVSLSFLFENLMRKGTRTVRLSVYLARFGYEP